MNWQEMSPNLKLNILCGESLVEIGLLASDAGLRRLIRSGADQAACLNYINENW